MKNKLQITSLAAASVLVMLFTMATLAQSDPQRLESMRLNALGFAKPNAALDVADTLANLGR